MTQINFDGGSTSRIEVEPFFSDMLGNLADALDMSKAQAGRLAIALAHGAAFGFPAGVYLPLCATVQIERCADLSFDESSGHHVHRTTAVVQFDDEIGFYLETDTEAIKLSAKKEIAVTVGREVGKGA